MDTTIVNYTATASGTYGKMNELIGVIKGVLITDANVEIVSDNNPAATIARVILYKVKGNPHQFKLFASATSTIALYLLSYNGVTTLQSVTSTVSSGAMKIRIVCGYNFHFLYLEGSSILMACMFDVSDDTPVPFVGLASSDFKLYMSSDYLYQLTIERYGSLTYSGGFLGIQAFIYNVDEGLLYEVPSIWRSSVTVPFGIYTDGGKRYWSINYYVISVDD